MSVQLHPGMPTQFHAGNYSFTMDGVWLIYKLYADDKLTLWEIKETTFIEAQIQEIAVAIVHAQMDIQKIPYYQRASFSYDPSLIDLAEYRIDNPSQSLSSVVFLIRRLTLYMHSLIFNFYSKS